MTPTSWNIWPGAGARPAGPKTMVDVISLAGNYARQEAGHVDWTLTGEPTDVMLWRVALVQTPVEEPLVYTADGILSKAASIMRERGKQYDQPDGERSMGKAVAAFNIITGRDLQESEGWLLLQTLKDVRDRQKKKAHVDSLEDCVAYSALKAESRLQGR